jgi:zinc protease
MKKISYLTVVILLVLFQLTPAQEIDRTKIPELPPPAKLNLPAIQELQLSNGLRVVLMEKHEVPLIQLHVVAKTGIVNDPSGKSGLASMVMAMLPEGAAGKSSLELADSIDFLGADINSGTDYHFARIMLHTPVSKFDASLRILSDIVMRPDFPDAELARKKKERLTTLMQWHDEPTAIASVAFNKLLFGEDYPYGRPAIGNESSIKSINSGDLKDFHQRYFTADNSFIVAVGDITTDELKNKLEAAFGAWKNGKVETTELKNAPQVSQRTVYLIDKPGAAQSVISMGHVGAQRKTDDYLAINIMNTILGGSFTSRLNQNLREEHGYTYGAFSYFAFRNAAGPFNASSSVQSEVTDKALTEFMKEIKGILEPIPADEIRKAKNFIALGYPQNFQMVESIAGRLEEMLEYNLPADYFNNYVTDVLETPDDAVNGAAKEYIDPERLIIVVVGDRSKIEEGIKALNLGELKNLTIADVLGKVPVIE